MTINQPSLPWLATGEIDANFLGDGAPSIDGDTRVRCWFCAHYTRTLRLPVYRRDPKTGEQIQEWYDCRTCRKGLGHDPFILRRCDAFGPIKPQYRVKLPPEALQQGWRDDYGTEEYNLGRKNTIYPAA